MAGAGVPLRTLQQWMGHASITTTEIYADYCPSDHEAESVSQAFQGHDGGSELSQSELTSEEISTGHHA